MVDYVLADSGVVSRLTDRSQYQEAYLGWIADRRIAINFQVKAELLGCRFSETRRRRLDDLIASLVFLPNSEATIVCYSQVAERRRELQKIGHPGGNAGDGDVWVISSALEHRLVLLSHDTAAVELARAMGLDVFTNLPAQRSRNPT